MYHINIEKVKKDDEGDGLRQTYILVGELLKGKLHESRDFIFC